MRNNFRSMTLLICLLISGWVQGQEKVLLDEVVGVVGGEVVLKSDIQNQRSSYKQSGYLGEMSDCDLLEEIFTSKLLLNQAELDSLEVSESQVEMEMNNRLRYFVRQLGSEKKLEEFYKKTIVEIKEELRENLKNQMLIQRMQSEITANVTVTPEEVQDFFVTIPKDSLPLINAQLEMAQIAVFPGVNPEEVRAVRERLREFKKQVEAGEKDFDMLAVFYSEDPGSSANGGDLGLVAPGVMVPEFDAVAKTLPIGKISNPFKTEFGYHLMKMEERVGNKFRAKHILLKPKTTAEDLDAAKKKLQEVLDLIAQDSLSFEEAAVQYSEDEASANNGGIMVDPQTGSPQFDVSAMDPKVFFVADKLQVGEISEIKSYTDYRGNKGYRVIKLLGRTEAHKANLRDDYQIIQNVCLQNKQNEKIIEWTKKTIKSTYVRVGPSHKACVFQQNWLNHE